MVVILDKLVSFFENYVPPFIVILVMLPVWILWCIVWVIGNILINILVPFKHSDMVSYWWNANTHINERDRYLYSVKLEELKVNTINSYK